MTNKTTSSESPAKAHKIKAKKMTLSEFRSYLKGIMFVGGKDWIPNAQQWAAIVQIIDQLDDEPAAKVTPQVTHRGAQGVVGNLPPQPTWQPLAQFDGVQAPQRSGLDLSRQDNTEVDDPNRPLVSSPLSSKFA